MWCVKKHQKVQNMVLPTIQIPRPGYMFVRYMTVRRITLRLVHSVTGHVCILKLKFRQYPAILTNLLCFVQLIKLHHFKLEHGGTIAIQCQAYVTIKLYGTSTCGCNNNVIFFRQINFHVSYRRRMPATLN